jgi:hypothetical protein
MQDVPVDLRPLRAILYDLQHPTWGTILQSQIEQGLRETLAAPERSVLPTFLLEDPRQQPSVSADEKRRTRLQPRPAELVPSTLGLHATSSSACHYRAIHSSRERSRVDTHGQRRGGRDLSELSSNQVAITLDLALQAGGQARTV